MAGMGETGVLPTTWIVLVHLTMSRIQGGTRKVSPLQVCVVASKVAECGTRLLCLSIPRNPKMRQTLTGGPRDPRLYERRHSWVRR